MAIVSCPECSKKLKVADTSVGKKVKCSCGHVFVAQEQAAAPVVAAAPEKVTVACTECSAKLKVAATSLGKKMKCPKCTSVFVASVEDEAPPAKPVKKAPPPPEEDEDDFFSYGQAEAKKQAASEDSEDDEIRPKTKAKKRFDDDEDDEPKPKSKGTKSSASSDDDEEVEKPIYPSRLLATLFVTLLLFVYAGLFTLVFFGLHEEIGIKPIADELGLPKPGPRAVLIPSNPEGKEKEKDADKKKEKDPDPAVENKKETTKLNGAWIVVSAEMNGKSIDAMKGARFIFADGAVTTPDPLEGPFSIDAGHDPKWINLPTAAAVTVPGIYKLDGDNLQWCTGLPKTVVKDGKKVLQLDRPTKLDSKEGVLITLKREKAPNGEKDAKDKGKDDPKDAKDKGKDDPKDESNPKDKDKVEDKDKSKDKDKDKVTDKDKSKDKDKDADKNKDEGGGKGKNNLVGLVDSAGDGVPAWKVPEGWKEAKGNPFTVGAFAVEDNGKKVAVTVSVLNGKGGGLLANVNRWRAQLKLEAWSDAELAKQAKKMTVSGVEGSYVELVGPTSSTLGAIVFHDTQAWFFKLTGDNELAQREKGNLTKFLKSVKFR